MLCSAMQQYAHTTPAGPAPSSCFMDCELKRIIWRVPGQIWAGILGLQTPLPAMLKWGRLAELFIRSANLRRARASISPLGGARALPPPPHFHLSPHLIFSTGNGRKKGVFRFKGDKRNPPWENQEKLGEIVGPPPFLGF